MCKNLQLYKLLVVIRVHISGSTCEASFEYYGGRHHEVMNTVTCANEFRRAVAGYCAVPLLLDFLRTQELFDFVALASVLVDKPMFIRSTNKLPEQRMRLERL